MKSRTSFCNGTALGKDLTRFAPLWVLYTLCLLLGMALMYFNDGNSFWFANNMAELIQYGTLINLFYAPLVAMLLSGDLYNSRMCNALHAMPLKRGCWFGTHVTAGLLFSLIPTAIFALLSVPLLKGTCVIGGQWIALWTFLGLNLSYLCFFGIAVFSAYCAGNRVGMAAIYALLNGGAYVAWFLVDSIYTPMLYGVVTPLTLVEKITPVYQLTQQAAVELQSYYELRELYGYELLNAEAHFWLLPEGWLNLGIWALAGVGFLALGRILYGKRDLECAGDAMAFRTMEPVFLICVALCAAAFGNLFLNMFVGYSDGPLKLIFLTCGLVAGWFAGKMLVERTVRVFRLKNWLGLAALTAVLAATMGLTYVDVFGIEDWMPAAEDVKSVTFGFSSYRGMSEELTDKEDIEQVIRLQELALENRAPEGTYVVAGDVIYSYQEAEALGLLEESRMRYSYNIELRYTMKNSRVIQRNYNIWCDGEERQIVNEYLSRWEVINKDVYYGEAVSTIAENVGDKETYINLMGTVIDDRYCTEEEIASLLAAIQADCEARTMTQNRAFHTGHFAYINEEGERSTIRSFWIEFIEENYCSGSFSIFADSENTLRWLEERGLLDYDVFPTDKYIAE